MSIQRVLILLVALGAGVAAAFLALNLSAPRESAPVEAVAAAPTIETVQVMVARADIAVGTTVTESSFRWADWPRDGLAGPYIERNDDPSLIGQVTGSIARDSFHAGEPITLAKLASTDSGFLSAILPGGMRAVALDIRADTSAGGFILPNDRVDVIMTRRSEDQNRYITETILHNVRVLAIDQSIREITSGERNDGEAFVGKTATLELTPQQAEIITVAQQMSDRLTLALRSMTDAKAGESEQDALYLIGAATPAGRNSVVTVIRNGVPSEVVIQQ